MSKLFMKVSRLPNGRSFAWSSPVRGAHAYGPLYARMNGSEQGEFEYLSERNKATCLGAGGQYEYRVYDLIEEPVYPYAIVRPALESVRKQYPDACRIVDMRDGEESALAQDVEHARASIALSLQRKLKGSFGAAKA